MSGKIEGEFVEKMLPFRDIVFIRMLDELVLVQILAKNVSDELVLKELLNCIQSERNFIKKHGMGVAAKCYAYFHDGNIEAGRETAECVMTHDYENHYRKIINENSGNLSKKRGMG